LLRDVKPSNIVFCPETFQLKLVDFGLSIHSSEDNDGQYCGTLLYQAPETFTETSEEYSKLIDIWSCGIMLYEMLTIGGHPLNDKEKK
jgi:serine/threonine protein kinase